jgi:CheY-like chemotaxis protein
VASRTQLKKVLVLSDQPMPAALLGMLLELEGYEPAFAGEGENAEAALARVRPLLVMLVDHALDVARSDLFLARAARRQVGVVVFGTEGAARGSAAWAVTRRVPWFMMPVDGAALRRAIEESTASFRLFRSDTDRRRPRAEATSDGTLAYHDSNGRRWRVYDRRSGDRRQGGTEAGEGSSGNRIFVNDAGEEWRCDMAGADFLDQSAAALEQQLARARKLEGRAGRGEE